MPGGPQTVGPCTRPPAQVGRDLPETGSGLGYPSHGTRGMIMGYRKGETDDVIN